MKKQTEFGDSEIVEKIRALSEKTNQIALATWAADCAERVLHYFIQELPADRRPEKAITVTRDWVEGRVSASQSRRAAFEAHSAARTATSASAREAARSAGHAAATAHVSGHALHAAAYAVKAVFYASCFKDAEKNIMAERLWQYERLLAYSQSSV
jgi:hypothetical protein